MFELRGGGVILRSKFHGITGNFPKKHGITKNPEIRVFIAFLSHFFPKISKFSKKFWNFEIFSKFWKNYPKKGPKNFFRRLRRRKKHGITGIFFPKFHGITKFFTPPPQFTHWYIYICVCISVSEWGGGGRILVMPCNLGEKIPVMQCFFGAEGAEKSFLGPFLDNFSKISKKSGLKMQ